MVALGSFFVEEVLRGGGELVDVANWDRDLDPLVRVVESGLGIIRVGFPSKRRAHQQGVWPPDLVLLEWVCWVQLA
nr:hypothetical protein CFP56_71176 [Quercus suber]